jgi:hypothetical protein
MVYMKLRVAAFYELSLFVCYFGPGMCAQAEDSPGQHDARYPGAVGIQITNVNLLLTRDIVLGVHTLRGQLQRTKRDIPVTFDDSNSFIVDVDSAEIHITGSSLAALMNEYVFGYKGAPIKNVGVTFEGGRLIQTGTMHKGVDLPFKIEASLSVTDDGNVRVHAEKIKAEHLSVKGLLHFFGEDLEKLIHENPGRGVHAEGDDLILAPAALTPPPHIYGRVVRVSVVGDAIVLLFDSGRHGPLLTPPFRTAAYIYHRGGILRFGKLTMNDADLEIVGDRPGTFNFFQHEYKKQLVAGYSKNTAANGLVAHMVDYSHFESHLLSQVERSHPR